MSFHLIFMVPHLSHLRFFQLNCCIFDAACPLSVNNVNKSPMLPSHAHKLRGEGSDGEFFLSFLFPPPPFQTFSHSFYFQSNCYPIGHAIHLPSVGKANKSSLCHPPLMCCVEKAVMVSSPLSYIPPHLALFLTAPFSKLIAILLAMRQPSLS